MPRPLDAAKRLSLVGETAEVLARLGIDASLRTIATELGTSTRMLVYYFGTKENLILTVLEYEQQGFRPVAAPTTLPELRKFLIADWLSLTQGEKRRGVRILEQVFGAACAADSRYGDYTAMTLAALRERLTGWLSAAGVPAAQARTRATIGLAALQGLLIEHFASGATVHLDAVFTHIVDHVLLSKEP